MADAGGQAASTGAEEPSGPLVAWSAALVPVLLAESAWIYLLFRSVLAATNPGLVLSPAVVLAPYVAASLGTLLLGLLAARIAGISLDGEAGASPPPRPSPRGEGERGTQSSVLSPQSSELRTFLADVAITLLNLLLGAVCVLGVAWWEMYPALPPLDPAWFGRALEDARGHTETIAPLVWVAGLGVVLWWRGTHLVREGVDLSDVAFRFLWGSVALLVLLGVEGVAVPDQVLVGWLTAAYLLFGLAAAAFARLEDTREARLGHVDGGWQWGTTVLALLLLVAGFGIALLLLADLGQVAAWIRAWLAEVLFPILAEALRWIVHLLGLDQVAPPPEPATLPEKSERPGPSPSMIYPPEWLAEVVRLLFNATWIALLLYAAFCWISQWRWRRRRRGRGGVRERLPWRLDFDLRGLLLRLVRALGLRWPRLSRWLRWDQPGDEGGRTAGELYRRLLRWGAGRGRPREAWATPREYRAQLSARWPGIEADVHAITETFLRARYGSLPIGEEELAAALAGWERIARSTRHGRRN